MISSEQEGWLHHVHEVVSSCRQGRPTYAFLDEILGPGADRPLAILRSGLVCPGDVATYTTALTSELEVVAVLLALGVEPRSPAIHRLLFDALYVLWRFGGNRARGRAVLEGQRVLCCGDLADAGLVHLKLGLLLVSSDPNLAKSHFDAAVRAGVPLPKGVAGALPQAMPAVETHWFFYSGVRPVEISPATLRHFPRPLGGEWHGTFDLAESDPGPLKMFSVRNGVLSIDTSEGRPRFYVFDEAGKLIPSLSAGSDPFISAPDRVNGVAVLLDDWHGGFNVCHAMFDKMTRLGAYRDHGPAGRMTAVTFTDAPWYRQALASLGHDHVMPSAARWSLKADHLLVLSNHRRGEVLHPAFSGGEHAVDFIRKHWQAVQPGSRQIYISREDTSIRRIANEAEVQACFIAHGFEVHVLSGMTYEEQKHLFQSASHIASVHGAGLANLAYAYPGTRIFEMMPPNNGSFAYWVMAGQLKMPYTLFTIDDARLDTGPGFSVDLMLNTRDCRVDIERLGAAVSAYMAD